MSALGIAVATTLTRLIRSSMLEVIRMEYITTARAKGLPERTVIFRHAFRNSLISVVTVFGLQTAWLLGGVVIVEQVFAWPGMGRLMLQAAYTRDMAVVQAGVFVMALLIMGINLLVDISYSLLDPRIRGGIIDIWFDRDYQQYAAATNHTDLTLPTWQPADEMRLYIKKDIARQVWKYGVAPAELAVSEVDTYEGKIITLAADQMIGTAASVNPYP